MNPTLRDYRSGPRAFTRNTSEYFKIDGMNTAVIVCTAVSSGTFKVYGSMDYGVATTPTWVPIGCVDFTGVRVEPDTAITPSTSRVLLAAVSGFTYLKITELDSGTMTLQVAGVQESINAFTVGTAQAVTHGKTILSKSGTLSADTDIVTAVTGKRIKVFAFLVINVSNTSETVLFKSNGAAGTEIWRVYTQGAGANIPFGAGMATTCPSFLFGTVAGEKLTVDVTNSATIHYAISYWADDAS